MSYAKTNPPGDTVEIDANAHDLPQPLADARALLVCLGGHVFWLGQLGSLLGLGTTLAFGRHRHSWVVQRRIGTQTTYIGHPLVQPRQQLFASVSAVADKSKASIGIPLQYLGQHLGRQDGAALVLLA